MIWQRISPRIVSIPNLLIVASTAGLVAGLQSPVPTNYDEAKVGSYTLPDPLVFNNGKPVRNASDWMKRRRAEILQLFGISAVDADTVPILVKASPVVYVKRDMPPFLLVHGSKDEDVPHEQSVEMCQKMKAAGAHVVFSTVLGDDAYKDFVLNHLKKAGVECRAIIDSTRPTVNKNAIVAGGYRLLKLDTLDNRTISDHVLQQLTHATNSTPVDAVVFSDFRHGIFNRRTIPKFVEAIPDGCYRVADSQVASRWGNITEFKGFDLITPNEREARFALADQDSGIRPLASSLYDEANCKLLILKLGDRGVLTCRGVKHEPHDSFFVIDSFVDRLVDAVGAGDALLAYSTLAMLTNKNPVVATILGSMAAACECEVDGNAPVTPDDVRKKIEAAEKQADGT